MQAVLDQERRPDRVLAVITPEPSVEPSSEPTGSDGGPEGENAEGLLAHLARLADDAALPFDSQYAPFHRVRLPPAGEHGWLWWIHDDSRPDPQALRRLMDVVETSPSVTIAGCKQIEWGRPRHLLDVGLTVSGAAEPYSLVEPGELDQGQYDARTDVFAVSAPGLLVRADVWDRLDGTDPATPEPAAAVDLCWRSRLAGHRVVVVPGAVIEHHGHGEGLQAGPQAVREASLWLRLKHARPWAVPLVWIWGLITAIGGFAVSLLAKEPGRGLARLLGSVRTLVRVVPLLQARRRARRTRTASRSIVAPLRATRPEVRGYRRSVLDLESPDEIIGDGTGTTLAPGEATGGHDDFAALATPERNWVGTGLMIALLVLGGLSLLGLRELLAAPALTGGSLLPVSGSPAELWQHATGSWAPAGAGAPVQPAPFGLALTVLGATGAGSLALVWLTVLAMPLAAVGAWLAAGAVARGRGVRLLAALLWGLSPALLTAAGSGRPGALLVHLALPFLALAVIRATGSAALRRPDPEGTTDDPAAVRARPGHRGVVSWTASGWTALLLAGIGAAAPLLLLVLVPGVLVLAALLRRRGRGLWWTPLPALALHLPVVITHWTDLRAVLGDPGVPQAHDPAPLWQQVLGFPEAFAADAGLRALPWLDTAVPGGAGFPWALTASLVIGVPVLAAALVGAVLTGRLGTQARLGLGFSLLGLVGSLVAPLLPTALDADGRLVTVYTGPFTSTVLIGVLVAAVAGFNGLLGRERAPRTPHAPRSPLGWPRRTAVVVLATVTVVSVALTATVWLLPRLLPSAVLDAAAAGARDARTVDGEADPVLADLGTGSVVAASPVRLLPATAADQGASALAARTVVLQRRADELQVSLASGTGPTLDRLSAGWTARSLTGPLTGPTAATPDRADEQLRTLAAQLVSGATVDPRPVLADFGAGFVVLRDRDGGEQATAAAIDAVPGLAPVGLTDSGWLWRVVPEHEGGLPVVGHHGLEDRLGFAVSRVRIEDAEGRTTHLVARSGATVDTRLPAAEGEPPGRRLVLAERADAGWQATLDGEALTAAPVADGDWNQSFELPERGGELRVWHSSPAAAWAWWVPGILLVLAVLLAIPSPARRTDRRPDAAQHTRPVGPIGHAGDRAEDRPETNMSETGMPEAAVDEAGTEER